jgi:Co/Zn/Cd efflux system component
MSLMHVHADARGDRRVLAASLALLVGFMVVEVVLGIVASSLALLADAGHMLTDASALGLALFAAWAASLPARGRWTFGLGRAEILAAFVGTAVAGALILLTGWDRFDPIASLFVASLMVGAGVSLLRESGRIFLEGAPESALPADVGRAIAEHEGVVETHDLHVWTVTEGFPALSAHVLVEPGADCHRIRLELERMLGERFGLEHTTLQVEHVGTASGLEITRPSLS